MDEYNWVVIVTSIEHQSTCGEGGSHDVYFYEEYEKAIERFDVDVKIHGKDEVYIAKIHKG